MVENMKIENLYVGQTISNHKELCKILEVDYVASTNSIKGLRKKLAERCSYDRIDKAGKIRKDGRGYLINEIYPTPKKSIDGRSSGNNVKYANEVTALILDYISTSRKFIVDGCNRVFELSNVDLFNIAGLCNEDYFEHGLDNSLCSEFNLKKDDINLFYYRTYSKLLEVTRTSLGRVERTEGVYSVTRTAKITTDDKPRLATIDELEIINNVKSDVLDSMGISYNKLHRTGKYITFLENLNHILNTKYGWTMALEANEITISPSYINSKSSYLLENDKALYFMKIVNSNIHHFFDSNAERIYRKFITNKEDDSLPISDYLLSDDIDFIKGTSKKPFTLSSGYVEKQQCLNERLIKLL
jgi:hypothetical protein